MTESQFAMWTDPASLPYLTFNLPGCGGTLKSEPDDFVVEELPAYEPSGEGEHLILWIEKRDVGADDLTRHIADTLGISRDDVGMAGLKDRRAVTRQYVSVPATCEDRLAAIETDSIRVLRSARHGNKLRTGHLRGNHFEIVLRNVARRTDGQSFAGVHASACNGQPEGWTPATDGPSARQIAAVISQQGFPNYYGEQRFGIDGETLALGLDLLTGRKKPRAIPHRQRRFLLKLALSSVQSALFNEILAARLNDRLLHTVIAGDVMQVRASGGPFVVEDVQAEQLRFDAGETVITGPMFGPKMRRPVGTAAERESEILQRFGLTREQFAEWKRLLPGTRRPFLAFASGLSIEQTGNDLRLTFGLDRGVYATTLLREVQKSPANAPTRSTGL